MRYSYIVMASAFLYVFFSCVPPVDGHDRIIIVNQSKNSIGCQEQVSFDFMDGDTIFRCNSVTDWVISADSIQKSESPDMVWEIDLKRVPYIQYLFLDGDLFHKYYGEPCDTIRKYVPVLRRYQVTLKDLERLNWTVTYPPTDAMKEVKMYPPYGR